MYRPQNWSEVRKQLIDGLDPEGALEAGFDAALIALYKKGNYMPCGSCDDTRFSLVAITEKDIEHMVKPQEMRVMDIDC